MGQGGRGNFSTYRNHKFRENLMDLDGDAASSSGNSSSSEGFLVHFVSRLDTLAGIAIKYGVEVADIKKLNGLTTDLQMFARKSLRIPLPGRHPPSEQSAMPGHSNADPQPRLGKHSFTCMNESSSSLLSIATKKESSAMGLLRGYYGLPESGGEGEGTEMEVITGENGYQSEDEPFTPRDEISTRPKFQAVPSNLSGEPKLNSFNSMVTMARDFVASEVERARDRMAVTRRRPKGESLAATDDSKQELMGERLVMKNTVPRPKSASKVGVEVEVDCPSMRAAVVFNTASRYSGIESSAFGNGGGRGGKVVDELIFKLKKSPSTPNLQDEKPVSMLRNGSKGDLAILSQGHNQSVTIPLLETFTRRSKAALD